MERVVRVLNVVFWIVAPLLVAALFLLNAPVVIAVLMVAVALHQNLTSMLTFGATADCAPKVG
jgi:hypothetical protein